MGRKKKTLKIDEILDAEDNVADRLADQVLDDIGQDVIEGFHKDKGSRAEWEERNVDMMKLALQVPEKKSWPWQDASNAKYPLLTVAAIQFASRVDLFQGPDIVQAKVVGEDASGEKMDRAIRIKKHMSYQLIEQMEGWESDNDRLLIALPIIGSMFKKTFYDPVLEQNRSELVYPQDLVFDYWARDVGSAFRKTHILKFTPNQIQERIRSGVYLDADIGERPTGDRVERDLSEEVEGLSSYDDDDEPHKILEQHRLLDLDDDGYKEPYVVTVHKDSERVLRIVPSYDKEGVYRASGRIRRIEPIEYFTQFPFIPDPSGGNLGIGYGRLQGHLNEVTNTLINQLVDAGTLANTQGGFLSKGIRLRAGDMNFDRMGEWKQVATSGVSLRDGIFPLPAKEPSQTLFLLLQMIVEGAEKVGSITDALVGESPPPNTPATSMLATLEQGLRVFKAINKRLFKSYTKEFKLLYNLNKKNMSTSEYFEVVGVSSTDHQKLLPETAKGYFQKNQMSVNQNDYKAGFGVIPSADPNADTGVERSKKVEVLMQSMNLGWPVEEIKKRVVESMNIPNPEPLLVPQAPPPPPYQLQVAQIQAQTDQAKTQADVQVKMAQLQIDQQRMALDAKRLEAEAQRMQMEMAKMEAEIRKIVSEVESEMSGEEIQIEVRQAQEELSLKRVELEIKKAELELKKQELQLKALEMQMQMDVQKQQVDVQKQQMEVQKYGIDQQHSTTLQTDKNKVTRKAIEKADKFMQQMDKISTTLRSPKEIKRDNSGLLMSVGDMKVRRGADGQATHIEPMENDDATMESSS